MTTMLYPLNFERDRAWIDSKMAYIRTEDAFGAVAVDDKGQYKGAIIIDNVIYSSAQVALIVDSPAAIKAGLFEWAAYQVFTAMGKPLCYAMVSARNEKSLRLCYRVGFEHVFTIPEGSGPGTDMQVLQLRRDRLDLRARKVRHSNGMGTK